MMTAEQVCNIPIADNDPMTTTGPQVRTLVEELFGRVDITTIRAGLDEPGYFVAGMLVRDYFMGCCALRAVD